MKYLHQRYILFEILSPSTNEIPKNAIIKEIWRTSSKLFGEAQAFQLGLWMIRWDPIHRIGILRFDNTSKFVLITTFLFITRINGSPVIVHTRKTSGTIKGTLDVWRKYFSDIPIPLKDE